MKKILGIFLLLVLVSSSYAIKVENACTLCDPIPIGVELPNLYKMYVTNTESTTIEYETKVRTSSDVGVTPATERTPYLREFHCNNCGKDWVADDRITDKCLDCGSTEIEGRIDIEGNKIMQYKGLAGKEKYFKKIEEIPDASFVTAIPRFFTLKPNETQEVSISIQIPNNSFYFNKFYEVIVSFDPVPARTIVADVLRRVEVNGTETQHNYFTLSIDGDPNDRFFFLGCNVQYDNPIDIMKLRIQLDGDWYDIYPIPRVYKGDQVFCLEYNKNYSFDLIYRSKGYIGDVDVGLFLTHKKMEVFQTAFSGRIWIKTVKDQAQNEAVIKSGKIEFIDPEELPPEITQSPTKTTAPPTIYITPIPLQESNRSLWIAVIGVLVLIALIGAYRLI